MTLRKKTLIFIVSTFICLIAIFHLYSQTVLLQSYTDLEDNAIRTNTEQALHALSNELTSLNSYNYDWAAWDDTYDFIEDANAEYIEANLVDETFIGAQLNLMVFANSSDQIVFAKAFDLENEEEIPVPQGLEEHLSSNQVLLHHPDTESSVEGLLILPENPMLITSRPVITSQDEGPIRGALIMGRYLNPGQIQELARITRLSLSMCLPDDPSLPPDFQTARSSLSAEAPIYTQPLSENRAGGYVLINDIYGQPGLILRVDAPRDIYQEGQTTIFLYTVSLLAIGLILAVILAFCFEKLVLSRLFRLGQDVKSIGESNDFSARVSTEGSDELARLAEDVNKMLAALERTHNELKQILSTTPNTVLVIDRTQRIVLANRAFHDTFKLKPADVEGRHVGDVIPVAGLLETISEVQAGRQPESQLEFRYKSATRQRIMVASISQMVEKEVLLILRDVTDERERLERLYLTDRLVSVGEMASGIAHELNNPLTGVIGFAELLMDRDLPDDVREEVEVIHGEAQRSAAIVKNFLTFAQTHMPVRELTQANSIIENAIRLRAYEHRINNIQVDTRLDPELPEIMVDCFQMQQVFLNIALNAESAMIEAHGRGTLKVTSERTNNTVIISFSDDGPGIAKQDLKRIFDPFFTTKEVGKGTGLGLSICHGIVNRHGGKIYARNNPGEGATFVVELPANAH